MIKTFLFVRRYLPLVELAELVVDFITPAEITVDATISAGAAELFMKISVSASYLQYTYMMRSLRCDDTFLEVIAAKYDKMEHPGAMKECFLRHLQAIYDDAVVDAEIGLVKRAIYIGIDPRNSLKSIDDARSYVGPFGTTKAEYYALLEFLIWCRGKPIEEIRYACSPALSPPVHIDNRTLRV